MKWMKDKGVVIDVELNTLHVKDTGETFNLKEASDGHLFVYYSPSSYLSRSDNYNNRNYSLKY